MYDSKQMSNNGVSRDRRIERTKRSLRDAAIAVLLKGGWDALLVQNVSDHANVGRSTFYLHYREAWEPLYEALREDYRKEFPGVIGGESALEPATLLTEGRPLSYPLFAHVEKHEKTYRLVFADPRGAPVEFLLRRDVAQISKTQHASLRDLAPDSVDPDLVAQYLAGAAVSTAGWWICRDERDSAVAMAYWFSNMVVPGLFRAMGLEELLGDE